MVIYSKHLLISKPNIRVVRIGFESEGLRILTDYTYELKDYTYQDFRLNRTVIGCSII